LSAQPPRRKVRRFWRVLSAIVLALAAMLFFAYWTLDTQTALDYVVRRAVAAAEGHLTIEGAEGSLLSTVRIARIAWHGDEIDVEARETAVAWSPLDLLSRRLIVRGLGAKELALEFRKTQKTASGVPQTLALPLEVEVRNIGVQRLDWRTGEQAGFVTGITFGYAGGAHEHAIRALRFVTDHGTLAGSAQIAANPPYALSASLDFEGDGEFKGGKAQLAVGGNLERIAIDAKGTLRNADLAVKAGVTPFAPALVTSADVDARNLDLSQFAAALPASALTLTLTARPEASGFAGSLKARNEAAGPLDGGRIPVTALTSRFAWDGAVLSLSELDAELSGDGRARGNASLDARGGPLKLDLSLTNVDLARVQTSLVATRLSGTLAGEVDKARQVLRGDLRQGDLGLAFAATVEAGRVSASSLRAQAGAGTLTGSGTIDLAAPRAFALSARATRFDPARFIAMPEAQLDGTLAARGTLAAPFAVTFDAAIAKGSRFAGLDASGTAHAEIAPRTAKHMNVDLVLGASTLAMKGGYGTPADTLTYDVDIPRLAQLRPLAARYAKFTLPDPLAGSLRARGTVSGDPQRPGLTVDARAASLEWGKLARAASVDVAASIAPGGAAGPIALSARPIKVEVSAARIVSPQVSLASAKLAVNGTLAQHEASFAAKSEDIDLAMSAQGGIADVKRPNATIEPTWSGTVARLVNGGLYPFSLKGPARVAIARDRIEVGDAHFALADGHVDIASVVVDEGRVSTQGSFTGMPVNALAQLAGRPLPFASSLEIGGDWSIAASPRLTGTFNLRREKGDWFRTESATLGPSELALGITAFEVAGRFTDDALAASARFASVRAGTADAVMTLAAGRVPGRIDANAPLTASFNAELASLRPLQPLIGTLAVMDGRARIAVTARGSLAQPVFDGTMTGDALRFDLPQYGVHLRDGVLRARLADRSIVLDEFSLAGGAGRFTAKGTIARAAQDGSPAAARVEWEAKDFTIVNRPDLRLVADGKGALALADRKLALTGNVSMEEGRVDYEPSRVGTLSSDVVIVGQPRKVEDTTLGDLPLVLDLGVELGRDFRFTGEGLDTRLAGRVQITTSPAGALTAKGTIRAVAGTFYVFGQKLDIDRGRLLFDGPVDNPGLDVVALRKNLAVEAGVELTGTVKSPIVRLVSNPPVPDGEKLSWLLTGQGLDRASRNDLAMLGAASASLLGQNQRPITTQIANRLGLDDISVRDSGNSVTTGTSTQVVAFGKRISDRLTLVYEQGLSLASNALRLEYALSRTITLRAEAGTVSSVGVYYRRSFD